MVKTPVRRRLGPVAALWLVCGVACNAIVGIDDPIVVNPDANECSSDADCPQGARCLRAEHRTCVRNADCDDEGDCPGIPICSNGECRNDCSADPSSCLSDQICGADGLCYGTDPGHDSGSLGGSGGGGGSSQAGSSPGGSSQAGTQPGGGRAGGGGSDNEAGDAGASGSSSGRGGTTAAGGAGGAEAGEGGGGGEGGAPEPECGVDLAVSCVANASPARVRCEQGTLVQFDACSDGELCDTASDPPGECRSVLTECVGRDPGVGFCEGATRKVCGPDLVTVDVDECDSVVLCSLGRDGECAACVTDQHHCSGQLLEVCKADHTGFEPVRTCTSEPCNADVGDCSADACEQAGDLRCNGNDLESCDEDRQGFSLEAHCLAGLCDPVGLECDECAPGAERCSDTTHHSRCNDDGQGETEMLCPGGEPFCTGNGVCVECTLSTQCDPPNDCYDASCNTGSGTCQGIPKDTGTPCDRNGDDTNDGFCSADHECVDCVVHNQCDPPDECHIGQCGPNGQCNFPPRNQTATCGNGDYCDGSGNCVDCNLPAQCGSDTQCTRRTCVSHTCGVMYELPGTTCNTGGGRACDGGGNCVQCSGTGQAQCPNGQVCRTATCTDAAHAIGWPGTPGTSSSVSTNNLYLLKLPPITYPTKVVAFGISGTNSALADLVVYSGTMSGPTGSRIAQTNGQASITASMPSVEVAANPPNQILMPGNTYWLGFAVSGATSIQATSGSGTTGLRFNPYTFMSAFPANPTGGVPISAQYSIWLRVQDTE